MKTRIFVPLRSALAAALLVILAADVQAGLFDVRHGARPQRRPGTFALTAGYSGYLGSRLWIAGAEYRLAPNATVYVIGEGPASRDLALDGASIYIAGERSGRTAIVHSVIVRRAASHDGDREGSVGVAPEDAPR